MDASAYHAIFISREKVREICPAEYDALMNKLGEYGLNLDSWATCRYIQYGDNEYLEEAIIDALSDDPRYMDVSDAEEGDRLIQDAINGIGDCFNQLDLAFKNTTTITLIPTGITEESDFSNGEGVYFTVRMEDVYDIKAIAKPLENALYKEAWCEW